MTRLVTPTSRLRLSLLATLATISAPVSALGPDGSAIESSDYTLDFHEGPVVQSSRIIALAGSNAALVPGVVGYPINPASAAMRVPWSFDYFDWEIDAGLATSAGIADTDFDNNGDNTFANDAGVFITLGGGLQFGTFGTGFHMNVNSYEVRSLEPGAEDTVVSVDLIRAHAVAANTIFDGQLSIGVGVGLFALELGLPEQSDDGGDAPSVAGGSFLVGTVWSPTGLPVRAGAALHVGIPNSRDTVPESVNEDTDGNFVAQGYILPRQVLPPTEIYLALATQLFRRLNTPWLVPRSRSDDPRSAERRLALAQDAAYQQRGHLLISAGLKVTLPVDDAIGFDSFLRQEVERSGTETTYSPSLGVESEPWPDVMVLRAGTYLEPTRFRASNARLHGTFGLDVHVPLEWTVFGLVGEGETFRLGGAIDRAPRYLGWSVSFGIWH